MKTIATITGPTCSGKDHLLKHLLSQGHKKLVSVATRPKRPNEIDGETYYFITEEEYRDLVELNAFSQTVNFSNYNYGVTFEEIRNKLAEDDIAFVIVEPGGVYQYEEICKALGYNLFKIFVDTKPEVLNARITERTVSSLLDRKLDREYVEGVLRRFEAVVTGRESTWIQIHEWDVIINGEGDPILNYTSILAAYKKMMKFSQVVQHNLAQ